MEIARAIENIEKRTQRPFGASASSSTAPVRARPAPSRQDTATTISTINPVPTTFPTERKAALAMAGTAPRPVCACSDACSADCPCLSLFGTCSPRCPCKGCKTQPPPERTKGCSCKRSNCLKLYCECLAAQRMCDHRCNCEGCKNCLETLQERERAVAAILERNPLAFQPKVSNGSSQHLRGCNCRKSGCMKNYCECHQAGVPCTSRCACHQCRNTETFVSAKKMLIFAGVSSDGSSQRNSPERTVAKRKPGKRKARKAAGFVVQQEPPQTPTDASTRKPTALELLSRSAPPASRSYLRDDDPMQGLTPTTPSKRTASHLERHYNTERRTAPTAKRKSAKRVASRLPFLDRIEEAAAPPAKLPDVMAAVNSVYTARNTGEPELLKLSQSLLHAALAVESAEEEKEAPPMSSKTIPVEQRVSKVELPLSPTAAGLFCEEDYEEAAGDDDPHQASTIHEENAVRDSKLDDSAIRPNPSNGRQGALQERAVLQELSVWLRDVASGAPSLS